MLKNAEIVCTGCEEAKPATTEFFKIHKQCRLGLNPRCKQCISIETSEYRRKNGQKVCARKRRDYRKHRSKRLARERARRAEQKAMLPVVTRARIMCAGVRTRARELGLSVALEFRSYQFIANWLTRQPACLCCNTTFELFPKGRKAHQHSPSLDRFIPSLGYVMGNVALICWRCNNIKRDYVAADLVMVARWMTKFDKKK